MDAPEELSRRGRRALPLIAGALAALVVASLIYLHPAFPSLPKGPVAPPKPSPSLVSNGYYALYDFVSATTGWALVAGPQSGPARSFVYMTTDGAKHWNVQLITYSANPGIAAIQFFDSKRGVVSIGSPGQVYRTSDGGAHWDSVRLPPYEADEITFSDPSHGWLLASEPDPNAHPPIGGYTGRLGHFFATTDAGSTWTELVWPWAGPDVISRLQFRRSGEGWRGAAASTEPTVYSTTDGGASWHPHVLPRLAPASPDSPSGPDFVFSTSVSLLPGVGVIAITDYARKGGPHTSFAYTSFDGGTTWRSVAPPPGSTAWDLVFQDSSQLWAMPLGILWKSSDAGQSWKKVSQQPDDWAYQPHIIDAKHAWAELFSTHGPAGGTGLAITSDGGLHWKQVDTPRPS
jgi:photosystem II stability/assembly factor-like uncharacterized protein